MRRAILSALVVFALILVAGTTYLFYTTSGVRFLLGAASSITGYAVQAEEIEGRLADTVEVRNLQAKWPDGQAFARRARFSWRPLRLLSGRFAVDGLSVEGLSIRGRGRGLVDLTWPKAPALLNRLTGWIREVRVDDFTYQNREEEPVAIGRITMGMLWYRGSLSLKQLQVQTPVATVQGEVEAGFSESFFGAHLTASPAARPAGVDRVLLVARLKRGQAQGQLSGPVTISIYRVSAEMGHLEGVAEVSQHAIALRRIVASRSGHGGRITAEGEVVFGAGEPSLGVRMAFDQLRLKGLVPMDTALSGTAAVSGMPSAYKGRFDLVHKGKEWQTADFTGSLQGGTKGIRTLLTGHWLGGLMEGRIEAAWGETTELSAELKGRGFKPERVDPAWSGKINMDLTAVVARPEHAPPETIVRVHLPDSLLRGRTMTGDLEAAIRGDDVRVARFILRGDVFDLEAHGALKERILFRANVANMSGFVPGTSGGLSGEGWVRYLEGTLAGTISGRAADLSMADFKMGSLRFDASLDQGSDQKVALLAAVADVSYKAARLKNGRIVLSGTKGMHEIQMTAGTGGGAIAAALRGTYDSGKWQGVLTDLHGSDRDHGPWALERVGVGLGQPSSREREFRQRRDLPGDGTVQAPTVEVSKDRLRVAPITLAGAGGERLTMSADLGFRPLQGPLFAEWKALRLSRVGPLLGVSAVKGEATGSVSLRLLEREQFNVFGSSRFHGAVAREQVTLEVPQAEAEIRWDNAGGLKGSWDLLVGKKGSFKGTFSSPDSPGFAFPERGRLDAEWDAVDVTLFRPLLPQGLGMSGQLSGRVEGRFNRGRQFTLQGKTKMAAGTLSWTSGDGPVSAAIDTAETSVAWQEERLSAKSDIAVKGYGGVRASGFIPLPARFPLQINPEGRIDASVQSRIDDIGVITAFIPGFPQARKGRINMTVGIEGDWKRPVLHGNADLMNVTLMLDHSRVFVEGLNSRARFEWDEKGANASLTATHSGGGRFDGRFSSPTPAAASLPKEGELQASWQAIDLALFSSLLPKAIGMKGLVSGEAKGRLLEGGRLDVQGGADVARGSCVFQGKGGVVTATVESARLQAAWRKSDLRGDITLLLGDQGRVKGTFALPITASVSPRAIPSGPVDLAVQMQAREQGIVSALMPGVVRETKGKVEADVRADGTWQKPRFTGVARLLDAGCQVPRAGITLKDVNLETRFSEDRIAITSFRAVSGPGSVQGTGTVKLRAWRVSSYEGTLKGAGFQTLLLPDIRAELSPDLAIMGTAEELRLRGTVRIPSLYILGAPTEGVVRVSPDVVVVDAPPKERAVKLPIRLDSRVRIELGDQVFVRTQGLDARLAGGVDVSMTSLDDVSVQGKITVVRGGYKAYGVDLQIARGNIVFAGPPERPSLDILATKQVNEVTAGVEVTGTAQAPVVTLYSQPAMPDTDRLAYIVLGRPLGGDSAHSAILMRAASVLLSKGRAEGLQEKLKGLFGLDVLDVSPDFGTRTGTGLGTASSTLTPLGTRAPPGARSPTSAATSGTGNIAGTVVTVGRYLSPKLYVAVGRSLFTGENLVTLRYTLTKNLEIETTRGTESGADVFYKVQFD